MKGLVRTSIIRIGEHTPESGPVGTWFAPIGSWWWHPLTVSAAIKSNTKSRRLYRCLLLPITRESSSKAIMCSKKCLSSRKRHNAKRGGAAGSLDEVVIPNELMIQTSDDETQTGVGRYPTDL